MCNKHMSGQISRRIGMRPETANRPTARGLVSGYYPVLTTPVLINLKRLLHCVNYNGKKVPLAPYAPVVKDG